MTTRGTSTAIALRLALVALATAAIGSSSAAAAVVPAPPAPNVDGRSYEMVTPPDKNSRRANPGSGGSAAPGAVGPNVGVASPGGEGLLFSLDVGILDPDGGVNFSSLTDVTSIHRDADRGGWFGASMNNLATQLPGTLPGDTGIAASADFLAIAWHHQVSLFPSGGLFGVRRFGDSGGHLGTGWYDWLAGTHFVATEANQTRGPYAALMDDDSERMLASGQYRGLLEDPATPALEDPSSAQASGSTLYLQEPVGAGLRDLVHECTGDPESVVDEQQVVTIGGSPTGGSFTLTFAGQTTAAIAWDASPGAVQTALENLNNLAPGDVAVSSSNPGGGVPGGPYTVDFMGARAGADVPQMMAAQALTPSSPVTVSTTVEGSPGDATLLPNRMGDGAATDQIGVRPCAEGTVTSARGAVMGTAPGGDSPNSGAGGVLTSTGTTAMSADGNRVFFTSPDPSVGGTGQASCGTATGAATACPAQLFVRRYDADGDPVVRWISRSQIPGQAVGLVGRGASFEGASVDGRVVYFRTNAPLTPDDPNGAAPAGPVTTGTASNLSWDLYRYELPASLDADPADGTLNRVTAGNTGTADPNTNCPLSGCSFGAGYGAAARYVSDDGQRVYLVTASPIAGAVNTPPAGSAAGNVPGGAANNAATRNLYLYDHTRTGAARWKFVARIPNAGVPSTNAFNACASSGSVSTPPMTYSPSNGVQRVFAANCVRGTPSGDAVAFQTLGQLTADDGDGAGDVYLYDAGADRLVRLSAPPAAEPAYDCGSIGGVATCNGDMGFGPTSGFGGSRNERSRGLSGHRHYNLAADADGDLSAAYFQSRLPLVPEDTNGDRFDVYQWRDDGSPGGELSLMSPGDSDDDSYYSGNSIDGKSVFLHTSKRIDPREIDEDFDIYAARVGGGFPFADPPVLCDVLADACHGSGAGAFATRPSTSSSTGGNSDAGARKTLAVARPSRRARRIAARRGVLSVLVRTSEGGRVTAVAKARLGKRVRGIARHSIQMPGAGKARLRLRLAPAARQRLRHGKALRVTLRVSSPGARARSMTVRLPGVKS